MMIDDLGVDLFQNTKADMGPCKLFHSEVSTVEK